MNYITPDSEIKKAFKLLEADTSIEKFVIEDFNMYSITRFYLEMRYRLAYFEQINKFKVNSEHSNSKEEKKKGLLFRLKKRIINKIKFNFDATLEKKYNKQFDNLDFYKDDIDVLFVATSGFKNSKNYSIELEDIINHEKSKNKKVAFVLPNYDINSKRRPEYDYLYPINVNEKMSPNPDYDYIINDYMSVVKNHLKLLNESDLKGIRSTIYYHVTLSNQLTKIIQKIKPKYVVARSLYSDKWVTMACFKAHTKSIEIQHGTFTENNFYYHSLSKLTNKELLIPDFILCLGEEWLKILRNQSNTWKESNSSIIGTSISFKRKLNKKGKKNVLIAFQDFSIGLLDIRLEIFDLIKNHASQLLNYNFILRIHPADNLSDLPDFSSIKNVIVSDPKLESTSHVLAKSDVLICATSMMLYEALNFKIPVISFERYRKLTQETAIYFVNSAEDIYECLKQKKYNMDINLKYLNSLDFTFYDSIIKN